MTWVRALLIVVAAALIAATPALAAPHTTVDRTYQDRDGDLRLEPVEGDEYEVFGANEDFRPPRQGSILNFLQLSDFQMVDEESPGRVEFFDTTQRGPFSPFSAAYRPQESLTTQITEAMVRQARNTTSEVTGRPLELTILTGDNADSQQYNETRWFIDILDGTAGPPGPSSEGDPATAETHGRKIDPDSGIPSPACDPTPQNPNDGVDPTPETEYDGVQGGGKSGYYDPDSSDAGSDNTDGDGYSPDRNDNGGADEYPERNPLDPDHAVSSRDFPSLLEEAQEPFEAVGLDMPWYSAFGNHDALIQGNSPKAYEGPLEGANRETANEAFQSFVKGCLKPTKPAPGLSQDSLFGDNPLLGTSPLTVPPDPRRCYLAKDEAVIRTDRTDPCQTGWIQEHAKTTGEPVGHGFSNRPPQAEQNNDGYYSFVPRPGLRFVVLDTVTDECGIGEFCSEGSIDDTQFRWLESELQAASGEGQYAMVFGHHTLRTMRQPTLDSTERPIHYGQKVDRENPPNPMNPEWLGRTLEELFCEHPNTLAYVAGHEHANVVERYECARDRPPTPGPGDFLEVGTAAHIDWPQQSRMIELVDNGNGTTSLVLTLLDHAGPPEPGGAPPDPTAQGEASEQPLRLASIGRELAYNDPQGERGARGGEDDRNVIYVLDRPFPYSPDEDPSSGENASSGGG